MKIILFLFLVVLTGYVYGQDDGYLEYELLSSVSPVYPPRALERGIEGTCVVEYTVSTEGTTNNIRAIDCQPVGIFDEASIAAASQFKYFPRMVNGQTVDVTGVMNRFRFIVEK